jgi:type II secretory ATPase GspE/PulE/Tfp pilus assembly ATPase PilB-like protein
VKFLSECNLRVVLAPPSRIEKAIHKYYNLRAKAYEEVLAKLDGEKAGESGGINLEELERASEEAPVVKLVATLMTDAIEKRASDIHIEPYENRLRVRFRITACCKTSWSRRCVSRRRSPRASKCRCRSTSPSDACRKTGTSSRGPRTARK